MAASRWESDGEAAGARRLISEICAPKPNKRNLTPGSDDLNRKT